MRGKSLKTWCEENNKLDLLDDWDYAKNGSPSDYSYGSTQKVSWVCNRCGYTWVTRLNARTRNSRPTGCRRCSRRNQSSFPEQAVYYYIKKYFKDAINGDIVSLNGRELDIYIPSLSVAIEYDGNAWHQNINKDLEKDRLCYENNIILYRIRESNIGIDKFTKSIVQTYKPLDWCALSAIIRKILINCNVDVKANDIDIQRDSIKIKEQFFNVLSENSLAALYPAIAAEWDYDKNGTLKPSMISPQDHDAYWWICPVCKKSYKAIVKNRTTKLCGCNSCGAIEGGKKQMSRVRNITTNQIFDCIQDAADSVGVSKAAIVKVCQGHNKTCKGYQWEYIDRDTGHRAKRLKQPTQRPILNVDTGERFDSIADAVEHTHISNISAVCRGLRQTAGGYHWKYTD